VGSIHPEARHINIHPIWFFLLPHLVHGAPLIRNNPGTLFGARFWPVSAPSLAIFPRSHFSGKILFLSRATELPPDTPAPRRYRARGLANASETPFLRYPPPRPPTVPMSTSDPILSKTCLAASGGIHPRPRVGGIGMTLREGGCTSYSRSERGLSIPK
jgi:hypothetical protein